MEFYLNTRKHLITVRMNQALGQVAQRSCIVHGDNQNPTGLIATDFFVSRLPYDDQILEGMSSEEWLRALGLSRLEKRRLMGNLIALCSFLRRGCGEGDAELFSWGSRDRTPGNGSKLHQGRFRLDMRKQFFTQRVVKPWNRLPGEVVDAPSLSEFEAFGQCP
ncbi:hypothetical protein QYF61_016021 [Mycteria americana]|uniref:Uncharacterized protein n=1 Tax=Mycteria americana TaxID=33587 RepID=A0AAN7RP84_MYCAM|nr:hypothetical protein QYF61_016021 [Mycteria americana]